MLDTAALDAETASEYAQDLSVALMLTLERLSPLERAAFLLHDVFDLDFAGVAHALGRSEAACRQLAARAREHVRAERPRFTTSAEEGARLAEAFREAAKSGDASAMAQLLTADAVLYSDGGGKRLAALNPIYGADKIARFCAGVMKKEDALGWRVRAARINGLPGYVFADAEGALRTVAFEFRDGRIAAIYLVVNPDKLQRVAFGDYLHQRLDAAAAKHPGTVMGRRKREGLVAGEVEISAADHAADDAIRDSNHRTRLFFEPATHSIARGLVALAVGCAEAPVVALDALEAVGELRLDFGFGKTVPGAHGDLAQAWLDDNIAGASDLLGNDRCGLPGTAEWAHLYPRRLDSASAEPAREDRAEMPRPIDAARRQRRV